MIRNYFADLELSSEASLEEIRLAYKRLARRFHPDLNPMDPHAEESFKRIREAFDYLNSADRLAKLRNRISKSKMKESPSKWSSYPLVPPSAQQFVKEWIDEPSVSVSRSRKLLKEELDAHIYLPILRKELGTNFQKKIRFHYEVPCQSCRSGVKSRGMKETCKRCSGLGFFSIERGAMQWKKTCDECRGKGSVTKTKCAVCLGNRKIKEIENLNLHIPSGADEHKPLLVKGFGNISFDRKKRGDLWVYLQITD